MRFLIRKMKKSPRRRPHFFLQFGKEKIIRCPEFILDVIEENWGKDFTL